MFVDLLFPDRISRSLSVNRVAAVEILTSDSRVEQRNARGNSRIEINCRLSVASPEDLNQIASLWEAVEGNLKSFRCRDWSQWYVGYTANGIVLSPTTPQNFAVGNGTRTTFQLVRRYVSGTVARDRKITKPRQDPTYPLQIFVNGSELTSGWSVNYQTGIVTFSSAPATGAVLSWRGIYDLPVRFDGNMSIDLVALGIGATSTLKLLEVFSE